MPLKSCCRILLLVLLCLAVTGVHESAHAASAESCVTSMHGDHSACPGDASSIPLGDHDEADGCDTCVNCACHAPLTVATFRLCYTPIVIEHSVPESFFRFPEVYLSKFVPPQLAA